MSDCRDTYNGILTLESRDADEMLVYWISRVACEKARAKIINLFHGMTGMQWIEMLTSSDGNMTEMLLEEDCGIKPRPERMVITSEAVSAIASVGAQRVVCSQEEMRSKIMSENAKVNARMKDRMEARYLAKQEANKGKLVKMDGMPVMPQPTSGETMLTPVQLERYKVALKTYINPYDTFAAVWAASRIDDYQQDPSEYLDGLDDEQKSLDARLGASVDSYCSRPLGLTALWFFARVVESFPSLQYFNLLNSRVLQTASVCH